MLLGGIPKLLSFFAFGAGSWYLSNKMTDLSLKPYDKKAGSDAAGLAGPADTREVAMVEAGGGGGGGGGGGAGGRAGGGSN